MFVTIQCMFVLTVSSSQPSSQKIFGKRVAHTSKNRVGRVTASEKDVSTNGEDSNQGNVHYRTSRK